MKPFLILLFLISCQPADTNKKAEEEINRALAGKDTALAKALAQKELDRLRSTVKDSAFAIILDANLQIQKLEFVLQKADSTKNIADEFIVNHPDGRRLYDLMMKSYTLALQHSSKSSDISFYSKELSVGRQLWFETNFAGKSNKEAKKSLFRLQRDMAIISAIVNHMDSDGVRKQMLESYENLTK